MSGKKCIWEEGMGNGHRVPTFCPHNALLDSQGTSGVTHKLANCKVLPLWTGQVQGPVTEGGKLGTLTGEGLASEPKVSAWGQVSEESLSPATVGWWLSPLPAHAAVEMMESPTPGRLSFTRAGFMSIVFTAISPVPKTMPATEHALN